MDNEKYSNKTWDDHAWQYADLDPEFSPSIEIPYSYNINNHLERGYKLFNLGKFEEALFEFDNVIKRDKYNSSAIVGKALVYSFLGRNDEALVLIDQAIELDPENADVWLVKGTILSNLGRNDEVLLVINEAIGLDPNHIGALVDRGIILANLGRNDEAKNAIDKALTLNPNYFGAWIGKGIILANLGRNDNAIAAIEQAIELSPENYFIWILKGNLLSDLGKDKEANDAYRTAEKLKDGGKPDIQVHVSSKLNNNSNIKEPDIGSNAGFCRICGSPMVWRKSKKTGEIYRGCTNYNGGCRNNDRSY